MISHYYKELLIERFEDFYQEYGRTPTPKEFVDYSGEKINIGRFCSIRDAFVEKNSGKKIYFSKWCSFDVYENGEWYATECVKEISEELDISTRWIKELASKDQAIKRNGKFYTFKRKDYEFKNK